MSALALAVRNLHQEPADWSLDRYARHAWWCSLGLWAAMVGLSIAIGLAIGRPRKMFGEMQLFTIYTGTLLLACSFVCWQCARYADAGARGLWRLMGVGFAYLATDELLKIHEYLDLSVHYLLGADPENRITDQLDDAILVLYALIGVSVLAARRRHVLRLRGFARGVLWCGVFFVLMLAFDWAGDAISGPLEARLEAAGAADVQDAVRGDPSYGLVIAATIIEESCKGLAVAVLFWTLVVARFQLRRGTAPAIRDAKKTSDAEV